MAYRSQLAILCALLVPQVCDAGMYRFGETTVSYRFGEEHTEPVRQQKRDIHVAYVTADWCSFCRQVEQQTFPKLRESGWRVGTEPDDHIRIMSESKADVLELDVRGLPAWFLIDRGEIKKQMTGFRDHIQVANWFNDYVDGNSSAAQAPTTYSKIEEGLKLAGLKPGQSFIDIGCGDGRALSIAVEQFKAAKATGIEIDSSQAEEARRRVSHLGNQVEIIEGDATAMTLPTADVAYVYLYPDVLEDLRPQLQKFGTVVSYMHQVPGLQMTKRGDFYIWNGRIKKTAQEFQSEWKKVYVRPWQTPGRECGNRACVMCYGGYQWRRVPKQTATVQRAAYCPTCRR